jgi:hypothetical protein
VKLAQLKLSNNYSEETPLTGMALICAHILDPFRKLQSFPQWDRGIHINPLKETSYTTQYHEAVLKYVENENCTKHRCRPVNIFQSFPSSNHISAAMASGSCQSSFDQYDLPSLDEEYLMPNGVAETTPA